MDNPEKVSHVEAVASEVGDGDTGVSFLEMMIVLAKYKLLILGAVVASGILGIVYSMGLTPIYSANTRIMPPQQPAQSAFAMLSAGLGATLGGGLATGALGIKNPGDIYVTMLKSRVISDRVIDRLGLMEAWGQKLRSRARAQLAGMTTIKVDRDGTILLQVDDEDPARAAEIANAYIEELSRFTSGLALTDASQRRLFFERQLNQAKENLMRVEKSAKQALQTGVLQVEGQGRSMVENAARLRAQISVKEVQIESMRAFATDQNPQLVSQQRELAALRRELAKVEGEDSGLTKTRSGSSDRAHGFESLGMLREVKYFETLYEMLAKQYEIAKAEEAKDAPVVQIIDRAEVPDYKSKPSRARITIVFTLLGFALALVFVMLREMYARAKADPFQSERLTRLKQNLLSWRRPA